MKGLRLLMRYTLTTTVRLIAAVGIFGATQVSGNTLVANFDSFPEGSLSPSFVDNGLQFSNLIATFENLGRPFNFVAEEADVDRLGPLFSPKNVLASGGFSPGLGFGFGNLQSFVVTPPVPSASASMDMFLADNELNSNKLLSLQAYSNGDLVRSQTIRTGDFTNGIGNVDVAHTFNLNMRGGTFDTLKFFATGIEGEDVAFAIFDNVAITLVPEPSAVALLAVGLTFPLARTRI